MPALRVLAIAAVEDVPYPPALGAAEHLAGMPRAHLAVIVRSQDSGARRQAAWKYAKPAGMPRRSARRLADAGDGQIETGGLRTAS